MNHIHVSFSGEQVAQRGAVQIVTMFADHYLVGLVFREATLFMISFLCILDEWGVSPLT